MSDYFPLKHSGTVVTFRNSSISDIMSRHHCETASVANMHLQNLFIAMIWPSVRFMNRRTTGSPHQQQLSQAHRINFMLDSHVTRSDKRCGAANSWILPAGSHVEVHSWNGKRAVGSQGMRRHLVVVDWWKDCSCFVERWFSDIL